MAIRDAYAVLGVARNSTTEEIRRAYKQRALQCHPDKALAGAAYADVSADDHGQATRLFQELQAAYEAIGSSQGRETYGKVTHAHGQAESRTELMRACEARDLNLVISLVEARADVNARDATGRTALMKAAAAALVEAVRLLIGEGADIHASNCAGHSVLMFSVGASPAAATREQQHLEVAELLLDGGASVNASTSYGLTALMLACASGRGVMADLLLSRGADVGARTDIGLSALVMACDKGDAGIARRLLRLRADHGKAYRGGKTALMGAAALGHVAVVETLLTSGAVATDVAEDGRTALLLAVERGLKDGLVCPIGGSLVEKPRALEVADLLLRARAHLDHRGPGGRTALHVACAGPGAEPAALAAGLLAAGADPTAPDFDGQLPADIAAKCGHHTLASSLGERAARPLDTLGGTLDLCCLRGVVQALRSAASRWTGTAR